MRSLIVVIILFVTLVMVTFMSGCRQGSTETPLPEITSESEEGFRDFVLAIEEYDKLSDGSQKLLASGTHNGKKVSIEIDLIAGWNSGAPDPNVPIATFRGTVTYRSVGSESDLLLQVMDELYGTKQAPKAMSKATEFAAISLEGDPTNLAKGPVKIKLFFESDRDDAYAELFTNIDLRAQKVYIREKDEEYRTAIIRALQRRI
jgi:hypothetical protein